MDDNFHSNKKLLRIPRKYRLACAGLWLISGTWSAQEETDGRVPEYMFSEWGATPKLIEHLIDSELWTKQDGHVSFPNWNEYQPTKQENEAGRARERERKAEWRARKNSVPTVSQRDTAGTDGVVPLNPSRPVPSRPVLTDLPTDNRVSHDVLEHVETTPNFIHPDGGELDSAALERARNEGFVDVPAIQHAIQEYADLEVYPLLALRVARELVGRRRTPPDHPQRYVVGSIRKSPEEVRQWIFANE